MTTPKYAPQSPFIREWLNRVRIECGSPERMREEAAKLTSDNTRALIIRDAAQWGAFLLAESTKHWSSEKR